jgi:hypothetical protein
MESTGDGGVGAEEGSGVQPFLSSGQLMREWDHIDGFDGWKRQLRRRKAMRFVQNSFSTRSLFCTIDILIAALYPKSQQKEAFAVTPKRIL